MLRRHIKKRLTKIPIWRTGIQGVNSLSRKPRQDMGSADMVAIVTGAGLGLDTSSAKVFAAVGQSGGELGDPTFNRYGENVLVNAATGNLMIDRTDEVLIGRGIDDIIARGYNSQSLNQGYDSAHSWQFSDSRAIVNLQGTINHNNSSVTRIDADGSNTTYNYDIPSGTYICTQAGSAEYRLSFNTTTNKWTWSDAKNNYSETYDAANGGRLCGATDSNGNSLSYTYDNSTGLLKTVTTADGETTAFNYNGSNQVKSITTTRADTTTLIRVRYTYDTSGRLSTVTTDLSPDDSSVSDGKKVVTTYAYDGTSDRVSKITQTGGAELDVTYTQLASGAYAVHTLGQLVNSAGTGTWRTTTFTYGSGTTTVTDPSGHNTVLTFDASDQLLSVTYPPDSNGNTQTYTYVYNSNGDLKSVTDPLNNLTKYTYDGNDNLSTAKDAYGNLTTCTYDTSNHIVTKTYTPGSGQSGPASTTMRYAYNSAGLLRFTVDGDGEVTEHQYNSYGQISSTIAYTDNTYSLAGLASTDTISESQLTTWAGAIANKSTVIRRTDYTYDFRGALATEKTYSLCTADANGTGVTTQPYTQVNYVYDQTGNLLQRYTTGATTNVAQFKYDGLNRLYWSQDTNGAVTNIQWSDSGNTCSVTLADTLLTVSAYDDTGALISSTQSSSIMAAATTTYKYDSLGQLSIANDPDSVTTYFLYDNLGRKTATIADDGSMTEYRYDADSRLAATIVYANNVNSNKLGTLVDGNGNPTNATAASVRPPVNAADDWSWRVYDNDSRLIEIIDGEGDVTTFGYDDMSNQTSMTSYYNTLSATTVSNLQTTLPTSPVLPTANAKDDTSYTYYDNEGRVIGGLDGDGHLSQIVYNHAGEKIETIAYATPVPSAHRSDAFSSLTSAYASAADLHTRYYYDDRGLLIYALDAMLRPTQYVHDAAGRVTETILYAGTIASTTPPYTLGYVQTQVAALAGNPNNRYSWAVYDTATGNLDYSIDAAGDVKSYTYDVMGRVVQQTAYVTTRSTTSLPLQSDMASWVTSNASSGDRTQRFVYNDAGQLRFTIDAENYIVENRYDAAGRNTLTIQYATRYLPSTIPSEVTMITWAGLTIPSTAVQTSYLYDADGRLTDTIADAAVLAADTHTDYDWLGQVKLVTVAYNTGDAAKTSYTYDNAGRLLSVTRGYQTSDASTTTYAYDGEGNMLTAQDGNGNTTVYAYDAAGQMLSKTDAAGNLTTYTYDSFGNVLTTTDPLSDVSYSFYDALNRQILQIDALGYATATTYSIGGAVLSVKRYASPYTGSITPGVPPATLPTNALDATTTFTLDKLDRVTKVTDAEGFYESYLLDAFGDRTGIYAKSATGTIQQGGETVDTYDRRGQMLTETLPISSYSSSGTVVGTSIENTYSYDARGNLKQKVEAANLPEKRTTTYAYDNLNRLTQTVGDLVGYVDDADINTTGTVTPTTSYVYDLRGNVVETIDASGAQTRSYYDDLDRKIAQVDALGTYTAWTYDDNSNMLTARIYATQFATLPTVGGTPPTPLNPTVYRQTTYTYDVINRLATTTVSSLLTGAYVSGSYTTTTGDVVSYDNYDKSINALRQIDGLGNSTWTYYDKLGRTVAEVDQDHYITLYTLDSNGNALSETRYSVKYTSALGDGTALSTLQTYAATNADVANDRTTSFTYDRNANRLTETRVNVKAYTATGSGPPTDVTGNSTITYAYNGLGEVLSKTQATNDATIYTYDADGRQIGVDTTTPGATMRLHTTEDYDGLGDLTFTDAYDALAGSPTHQTTSYTYGAGGRLTKAVDATGFEQDYFYDKMGRTVLTSYSRLHSDGSHTTDADVTLYDLLGRAVSQGTATKGSTWVPNDMQQVTYDAFGDTLTKSINGKVQQTYSYDNGGRMWKSTDEGVTTIYLYDSVGNQTLSVTSDGNVLSGGGWGTFNSAGDVVAVLGTIGVTAVQGMVETITVYDARGQATQVREPGRELAGNATAGYTLADINTAKTYNAFGEVTSETDGNGNTTNYYYNTLGKIIQQVSPQINTTDIHGVTTTGNPTQNNFYDISGRLIGVQDANSNYNMRALLANTGYDGSDVLVTDEYHADSGHVANTYDVFGNLIKAVNAVSAETDYTYDKMGRLLTETHPTGAGGGHLVDNYTYDGLGQRLSHWNSQLTSTVVETTDYDAEGRVAQTTDMGGHTTSYTYQWVPTTNTAGLGTYGAWTKTTVNTAGKTMTDSTDGDGRTTDHVDFGGNTLTYHYNTAGWLNERTDSYAPGAVDGFFHPTGEDLNYTYFNTGMKAESGSTYTQVETETEDGYTFHFHDIDTLTSDYGYDKNGNEVMEDQLHFTQNWPDGEEFDTTTETEYETATFDALNRMTGMNDQFVAMTGVVNGVDAPITLSIKYDLAGNVRDRSSTFDTINNDGSIGAASSQDDWYTYDGMNRFLITKGTLSGTTISAAANGTTITYDKAGERKTATSAAETDTYTYQADGYLSETDITPSGGGSEKSTSAYDLMGRVLTYKEYSTPTTVVYSKVTTYNNLGQDTTDTVFSDRGGSNGAWTWVTTYDYNDQVGGGGYTGQYEGGNLVHDHVHTTVTGGPTAPADTDSEFGYIWFDGASEASEDYQPDSSTNWYSTLNYDARQNLIEADIHDGQTRDVFYFNNALGQITSRDTGTEGYYYGWHNNITGPHARYYYYGGIRVGDVSNDGTSDVNYVTSITDHTLKPGSGLFQNGATTGVKYADFDASYDPINGLTYQDAPGGYVVQSGDTLQSIAQQIWGDANFWYLIADANGLDNGSTLVAGQQLIIPDKVANNQNNDSTYRVYNPNDAIGNISPTTPPKPQPHHSGCGILGQILQAIVTVVVSILTENPVLGDLVGQLFGMATGIQKGFDMGGLLMSAISWGVGGAIGDEGMDLFGDLSDSIGDDAVAALQGATANAISQGIGVATGIQKSFDWGAVAAAGVSAGVTEGVGEWAEGQTFSSNAIIDNMIGVGLKGTAALIAGAATRSLISGTDFGDNILSGLPDVIGQTLGGAIADAVQSRDQIQPVTVTPKVQLEEPQAAASLAGDTQSWAGMMSQYVDALYGPGADEGVYSSPDGCSPPAVDAAYKSPILIPTGMNPDVNNPGLWHDQGGQEYSFDDDSGFNAISPTALGSTQYTDGAWNYSYDPNSGIYTLTGPVAFALPVPPPAPDNAASRQALMAAQDTARNNPDWVPDSNGTHCNGAVAQTAEALGAPLSPLEDANGNPYLANQQARLLAGSSDYTEVDATAAQSLANNGNMVIVAWDNPDGHGHVATIRPDDATDDDITESANPDRNAGPVLNNVGISNQIGLFYEGEVFVHNQPVHYYTPAH
jgi:YD repeat-containing protein